MFDGGRKWGGYRWTYGARWGYSVYSGYPVTYRPCPYGFHLNGFGVCVPTPFRIKPL